MTHIEAGEVVAVLAVAGGQSWSAERIKLWSELLVDSRVPCEAARDAAKQLLQTDDPRKVYPAQLIDLARRKMPERRQLPAPDCRADDVDAFEALRSLERHPKLQEAVQSLMGKVQARKAAFVGYDS